MHAGLSVATNNRPATKCLPLFYRWCEINRTFTYDAVARDFSTNSFCRNLLIQTVRCSSLEQRNPLATHVHTHSNRFRSRRSFYSFRHIESFLFCSQSLQRNVRRECECNANCAQRLSRNIFICQHCVCSCVRGMEWCRHIREWTAKCPSSRTHAFVFIVFDSIFDDDFALRGNKNVSTMDHQTEHERIHISENSDLESKGSIVGVRRRWSAMYKWLPNRSSDNHH